MNISPDIQGAIIGGLISGLLLLVGFYYRTHTGNKVIINKTADDSLKGFRDKRGNSLTFNFKNMPVEKLYFTEYKFINNGYSEIDDLKLIVKVIPKTDTELLEVQLVDYLHKAELKTNEDEKYSYTITRPYLNMVRKDKGEAIFIDIFSDSPCDFDIYGGGKGWKTEFQKQPSKFFKPSLFIGLGGYLGILINLLQWFARDGLIKAEIIFSVAFILVMIFIIWLIAKVEFLQKER